MRIKIWIPGAIDVSQTVRIEYTVRNALRFFDPDDSNFEAGRRRVGGSHSGRQRTRPTAARSQRRGGEGVHRPCRVDRKEHHSH